MLIGSRTDDHRATDELHATDELRTELRAFTRSGGGWCAAVVMIRWWLRSRSSAETSSALIERDVDHRAWRLAVGGSGSAWAGSTPHVGNRPALLFG
ncbi:MAG TPA: hypothetical protein VH352_25760 [Pseudonocardiaceae bacterium]|nr:hypothetical protein [Pseudonocardiaceae bacterium]